MLKKIFKSPFFYPLLLVLICLFIAFKNYTPGTFLTGWDTLHPEFNFPVNFSRLLFGVWRPEQGFGAVSGHSAMADLPRVFILWLFHFVLPLSFLRYSYIFLCLVLGPLGVYFFLKYLFKNNSVSFLGALFYLLNLGTVQQFYVPFEMFPTQWAFLPWIILSTLKYLHLPSKFRLLTLGFWILLSTPQAYAAHLWYPFFGSYCLFVFSYSLLFKIKIKLPLILFFTTLLINSFWLLPNLYYLTTSSWIPKENRQNRLSSQEFLLQNRQTGNLLDSTLIKGFYFNWQVFNFKTNSSQQLMPVWRTHLNNFDVQVIGYSLFAFSLLGLIIAFIKKDKVVICLSPFFIIPFALLCNNTPPFNYLFDFLLRISLLQEVLRFIFTKVSTLMIFGQTIFLGYFLINISKHIRSYLLVPIFSICLLIYTAPVFSGYLIAPEMKVKIPDQYFQFWNYMKIQPNGKILALPLFNPSGWAYNSWGYQGSGIIWFGLSQSITDRDSDRWEPVNEESYREISTALYTNDPQNLQKYLQKYKLNYLFWDQSVAPTTPKNQDQITFKLETQKILNTLTSQGFLSTPQVFGNLRVYKVTSGPSLVQVGENLINVSPNYHWQNFDSAYHGSDYQTNPLLPSSFYSFRDILTHTNRLDVTKLDPQRNNLNSISFSTTDILSQNSSAPNLSFDSTNNSLSVYTQDQTHGFNLSIDDLPHQNGYIVSIKSQYLSGLPLRICFKNTYTGLCSLEDELSKNQTSDWDYFLVPTSDEFSGYQLTVNAISFAKVLSLSQINKITIFALPNLPSTITNPSQTKNLTFSAHFNSSLIKVSGVSSASSSQLIFNQSFNSGWLAFYFQGLRPVFLTNHILINNWANGWSLPADNSSPITVYLFFWPQLLQLLGFGLLITIFVWMLRRR